MRIILNSRMFKRTGSVLILAAMFSFLNPVAVSASFNSLPTTLPDIDTDSYIRLSTLGDDSGSGANDYAKALSILVYKDSASVPGSARLHFNSGDSCNDKDIIYSSAKANDSGNQTNSFGLWMGSSPRPPSGAPVSTTLHDVCNGDIVIPDEAFNSSDRFNGTIEVAVLRIELVSGVFTFNIGRSSASDKIRLSTIGVNEHNTSNLPLSYGTLIKVRGGGNTMKAHFGVPCQFGGGERRIFWKGADSRTSINPGSVSVAVVGGFGIYFNDNAGNGPDIQASSPINMSAGDKFTVTFDGISNDNNAILLWLPFDSAEYDKGCIDTPQPNSWQVAWEDSFVQRADGIDFGTTAGNLSAPDDEYTPRPGQSFRFINDVKNVGSRNISNGFWYCPISNSDHSDGQCWNGTPDRYWDLAPNTQTIAFDRGRTGYPDDTIAHTGTGVGPNAYINGPNWVWDNFGVAPADGGRTYCVNGSLWPSSGVAVNWTNQAYRAANKAGGILSPTMNNGTKTTNWNTPGPESRIHAPQLCVNVPFHYNLILDVDLDNLDAGGNTIQQGTAPSVDAIIRQEGATNGRNNTYSEAGKQKGLLQLLLAPGEAEPTNKTAEALSTSAPAAWCSARTAGAADCTTPYTSTAAVGVPNSPIGDRLTGSLDPNTDNLPVGTKLCYATYAQHPRNTESGDVGGAGDGRWSYSGIECAIVVKSPKVQFLNTDVTVGRQSSAIEECTENQVDDAPIITTGSPANRASSNLYGSWVEYGAFATGKITNFGSAAVPFGTSNEPRKLTFGNNGFNTAGDLGEFVYSKNCIADFFSMVKEDNTNLMSPEVDSAFDQTTGVLDMKQLGAGTDKTGYVANDKNILLGEPTTGSSAPDTTPAPTTQTIVKVSARAHNDMGNNGCPKLLVKVTDGGGNVDQDVRSICGTGFQELRYEFYQDTNGPKRIEARFINDGIVANVDRNIVLRTINVNDQDTYLSSRSSNPGSSIIGGGTNCVNSGNLYLFRSVSEGDPAINCFGVLINPVTAPLPPSQQQADYAPPEETTVTLTARATLGTSADGTNSVAGGCPYMYVRVVGTNGVVREHTEAVCNTSQSAHSFTVNLGGGGVASVDASFDPMDYVGGGQDRNLYISNVRVGTTSIPINASSGANVQLRNGTGGYSAVSTAPATCKDNDTVIFLSATNNVTNGWCASVRVVNITAPVPDPSPSGSLQSDYDGFKGRSIVIYAKKTSAGDCSPTSNGNITINKDLIYKKDEFASVLEIPRITIMADCNITIADNVEEVNANLIAGDAIKTCSNKAETQDKCNKKLVVRGAISVNRLLLWRTYGADGSPGAPDPRFPAETFDLSPSQIISGYNRGIRSAKPSTVYEVDLPPRY